MSEYEKIIHLKVEFEPLKVYETLKVEFEVTFGDAAIMYGDNARPAEPDELRVANVQPLRSTLLTAPSEWDDIYGQGIFHGLLQTLVDNLLDDSAVRADLIDYARACEDEKFYDDADYHYDRHRDRSLEA